MTDYLVTPIKTGCMDTTSAQIYYEIYGEGIPVLMLHGNAGSHGELIAYAEQLCGRYQVILMDSRGHGRSQLKIKESVKEFTASDMAKDVKRLMDYFKLDRGILLGFSDGANTALEFAARYQERTIAVISISGNAQPSGLWFPIHLLVAVKYKVLGLLMKLCPMEEIRHSMEQSRIYASLLLNSPALTAERLSEIKVPVLLIAGTLDLIKVSHTKWMAANLPSSRLVLIKGGTHGDFFRRQGLYLTCILDFLNPLAVQVDIT